MPSKTKLKNAAIAERSASLPKIPKELLDQFAQGPMTAETIQDATIALKKALIERALGGGLSYHLGYSPGAISLRRHSRSEASIPTSQSGLSTCGSNAASPYLAD